MRPNSFMRRAAGLLATACLLLAPSACGSGWTKQIASYPAEGNAPAPIAREPMRPDQVIVYNADLILQVIDVDAAAERAINMAYDHGGALVSSQSWYSDGRKQTTLTLAAPVSRFDSLRERLRSLGTPLDERISSELSGGGDAWSRFAHITVQLRDMGPLDPLSRGVEGWSPARTFERAFRVIEAIFHVVADVMIWVVVVGGPFALIGLVIWLAARQLRRRA